MARILIVDDDAHIVHVMSLWLDRHGHEVVVACNGANALEMFDRNEVDLVISDMNMPVLDGLALVKAIREERASDIPVLILTARCDQDKLAETMLSHQVYVYPKPFLPSRLVSEINRLLAVAQT